MMSEHWCRCHKDARSCSACTFHILRFSDSAGGVLNKSFMCVFTSACTGAVLPMSF